MYATHYPVPCCLYKKNHASAISGVGFSLARSLLNDNPSSASFTFDSTASNFEESRYHRAHEPLFFVVSAIYTARHFLIVSRSAEVHRLKPATLIISNLKFRPRPFFLTLSRISPSLIPIETMLIIARHKHFSLTLSTVTAGPSKVDLLLGLSRSARHFPFSIIHVGSDL